RAPWVRSSRSRRRRISLPSFLATWRSASSKDSTLPQSTSVNERLHQHPKLTRRRTSLSLSGERPVDIIEALNLFRLVASDSRRASTNVARPRHQANQGISSRVRDSPAGVPAAGGNPAHWRGDLGQGKRYGRSCPTGRDR